MRPQFRTAGLLALALAVLLAACGQSPAITVSVDQASVELVRGSEAVVTVTLTRTGGADADVMLSATGLPPNVTASFSPSTLSGGDLVSVLALTSTGAAAEGSYEVSITGSGTGLTSTATLTLDVTSVTVTGRVNGQFGIAIADASVESQGQTATTAADGTFTLSGLSIPYDLSVWNETDAWVHIYEGLSSSSLLLNSPVANPTAVTGRAAGISVTLSGDSIPVGANQRVLVCVETLDSSESDIIGCAAGGSGSSSYSLAATWWGSASRAVRVHALQVEIDANGFPVAYPGYTSADLTITHDSPVTLNLDMGTPLDTTSVAVSIDAPSAIDRTVATVQVGENLAMTVMNMNSPVTSHTLLMPVIPDATYTFFSHGGPVGERFGWDARVSGSTADVHVPDRPVLVTPDDAASGITTASSFSATDTGGGAVTFLWLPDVTSNPSVAVTTMANAHTLPDLAGYGLAIPAAASYSWQVYAHAGTATEAGTSLISDLANYVFLHLFFGTPGPFGEGSLAQSTGRSFTTAP